ncbi:MAG TPA: hypothetical protein VMZ30_08995 [Pyrinomonadaceae bacterium]|nr:hypothetical protein [Pyrinomonadaceae bacterium]
MMTNNNSKLLILLGTLSVGFLLAAGITNAQATKSPSRQRQNREVPQKKFVRSLLDIIDDHLAGKTPQDEKVIIPAKGGGLVANNIFKADKFSHDERYLGYKILDGVEYSAGGGGDEFILTAHGNDNALLMIEEKFINLLGITKADACRIDVLEYLVPSGGESSYVRSSFSFCAETSQVAFTQSPSEQRYFLRLSNCDDGCTADVNGHVFAMTGFAQDSGWIDFTEALEDGVNRVRFTVRNESNGVAYAFQVRKNQSVVFEQVCGSVGRFGCDNNRIFPNGVAREFTYTIRMAPAERTPAYSRWLAFLADFRTAVRKRDRVALRRMVAIPFETQDPGQLNSFEAVMKWLNREMWEELGREIAPGARFSYWSDSPWTARGRATTRCSMKGIFCFELGRDGNWRLAGQGENEGQESMQSKRIMKLIHIWTLSEKADYMSGLLFDGNELSRLKIHSRPCCT